MVLKNNRSVPLTFRVRGRTITLHPGKTLQVSDEIGNLILGMGVRFSDPPKSGGAAARRLPDEDPVEEAVEVAAVEPAPSPAPKKRGGKRNGPKEPAPVESDGDDPDPADIDLTMDEPPSDNPTGDVGVSDPVYGDGGDDAE